MSRKQEIYRDILNWALPSSRNCLSRFRQIRPIVILTPEKQRWLQSEYEVAEFVHNLYVSILEEDFTDHDIWFLNYQARSFFERNDDARCTHYSLFAYYIQELFKVVPEVRKHELKWEGPKEDYSWARPKFGWEINEEEKRKAEK